MKKKKAHGGQREGAGRKKEGRVEILIHILPEARDRLDAMKTTGRNSRGKVIESLLEL